ncbi:COX15/CtaA family protein [Rhodoblastus acidophilus]|uniref:Heme A synthase n=1 Tax=Candidatus Rhodoblastus alkanivorans TaxID=2954117 RepID=A0ABS9Z6H2_9HYPH|nr:COX15/CtaA family protein [Candidatus Rhodoblastus alkanivorans]MCI4680306.1 COX15/CtaA family protein [Candidatus Rhodoblastus alkanivorans]MCI4682787.1 COX15/CtaA family protein [Candidatus Rhodoblastus alkanivorans]MDI4640094.1 COX15/CtaA family protein [Rhodoblastus acidophilus]
MLHRQRPETIVQTADPDRAVRIWLWLVALSIFAMVVVGGATRLTESGLSITEWKPVTGALPPLNAAQWADAFEKYKQIPQYHQLFPDMDLARFKSIYAWEWSHRLLGRLIGVLFAVPFLWFLARGKITGGLRWRLAGIFALGGLQGFVGWWMVSSGLVHRVEVAPQRLAIHLLLASVTYAAVIWTATGLAPNYRDPLGRDAKTFRPEATALLVLVLAQIGLGGLVAGLRAGYTYNTWPLMDGRFIPPLADLFRLKPWTANFVNNVTLVQFQHRMVAYAVLAAALLHALHIGRETLAKRAKRRARALVALVLIQIVLGVATLLLVVPLPIAMAHQAFAMMVLAMATVHRTKLG